jgi:hypothetical protein
MIAAFDLPENKGKGVVSIDGRMVERLHADMARRTVANRGGNCTTQLVDGDVLPCCLGRNESCCNPAG